MSKRTNLCLRVLKHRHIQSSDHIIWYNTVLNIQPVPLSINIHADLSLDIWINGGAALSHIKYL